MILPTGNTSVRTRAGAEGEKESMSTRAWDSRQLRVCVTLELPFRIGPVEEAGEERYVVGPSEDDYVLVTRGDVMFCLQQEIP